MTWKSPSSLASDFRHIFPSIKSQCQWRRRRVTSFVRSPTRHDVVLSSRPRCDNSKTRLMVEIISLIVGDVKILNHQIHSRHRQSHDRRNKILTFDGCYYFLFCAMLFFFFTFTPLRPVSTNLCIKSMKLRKSTVQ